MTESPPATHASGVARAGDAQKREEAQSDADQQEPESDEDTGAAREAPGIPDTANDQTAGVALDAAVEAHATEQGEQVLTATEQREDSAQPDPPSQPARHAEAPQPSGEERLADAAAHADEGMARQVDATDARAETSATSPTHDLVALLGEGTTQGLVDILGLLGVAPMCVGATSGAALLATLLATIGTALGTRACCSGRGSKSSSSSKVNTGDASSNTNTKSKAAEGSGNESKAVAAAQEEARSERVRANDTERALQAAETRAVAAERELQAAQREAKVLQERLTAAETHSASAPSNPDAPSTTDTGALPAELEAAQQERDRYLHEWQQSYQAYVALGAQHQTELAQRDEALQAAQAALAQAQHDTTTHDTAQSAAAETMAAELDALRKTTQAREAEVSDLRSRLATLVPDTEEQREQLEQERARVARLTARCEQLSAQLEAAHVAEQAAELSRAAEQQVTEGLRKQVADGAAQLAAVREKDMVGLAVAERAELEHRVRAAEEQVRLLDSGHQAFLVYHNQQLLDRERKLENFKELFDDRNQKREAQLQEQKMR